MSPRKDKARILLTGATGFIGRNLLRELLLRGQSVTAIVRATDAETGDQRLRGMMRRNGWPAAWNSSLQIMEGSLSESLVPESGIVESCDQVIHCAAALNFDRNRDGEPWRTNVDGTVRLGRLAAEFGIRKFLYVSTAYVCGPSVGTVFEGVGNTAKPRNDYEASKQEAERWLVQDSELDWTIARPGIVVGDSRTGHTGNYFGVYRVLKSIARLCDRLPIGSDGTKSLPLRLPFTGNETNHLVPVDFVSSAIANLALRDDVSQECVHLTPDRPTTTATLLEAIRVFHDVRGIEFVGTDGVNPSDRNVFERLFDRETKIVGQYFEDDPEFDTTNRQRLVPDFPNVPVDVDMLMRLQAFGDADNWGNAHRSRGTGTAFDCADFFSRHFRAAAADSQLAQIPGLSTVVGFEIRGASNGNWLCRLEHGCVVDVAPTNARATGADFLYQADANTFQQILAGDLNIRQAFFERRINIDGDVERALLLAVLFEDLLQESPYDAIGPQSDDKSVAAEHACA